MTAPRARRLNNIKYTDAAGVERVRASWRPVLRRADARASQAWDACERTTRNPSASADGAVHTCGSRDARMRN